jgi:hypothetical protein
MNERELFETLISAEHAADAKAALDAFKAAGGISVDELPFGGRNNNSGQIEVASFPRTVLGRKAAMKSAANSIPCWASGWPQLPTGAGAPAGIAARAYQSSTRLIARERGNIALKAAALSPTPAAYPAWT